MLAAERGAAGASPASATPPPPSPTSTRTSSSPTWPARPPPSSGSGSRPQLTAVQRRRPRLRHHAHAGAAGRPRLGVPDRHRLGLRRRGGRDCPSCWPSTSPPRRSRPGHYDLVIDPSNLFLTIHESIGHATELDRALGYEAAYAGTSFATFDQLGSLHYGSPVMNVTGDRMVEHGLATIGYDDEGVAQQQFDIIRGGTLVGYQLNRQMAAEKGSAAPTAARSPTPPATSRCSGCRTCRCSRPRTGRAPRS